MRDDRNDALDARAPVPRSPLLPAAQAARDAGAAGPGQARDLRVAAPHTACDRLLVKPHTARDRLLAAPHTSCERLMTAPHTARDRLLAAPHTSCERLMTAPHTACDRLLAAPHTARDRLVAAPCPAPERLVAAPRRRRPRVASWLCAVAAAWLAGVAPAAVAADDGAAPAAACPPTAEPLTPEGIEAGLRDARDHGFLWRISKAGRSSYLYGTIHAARRDWMFPGPTVAAALAESDVVALELDALDPGVQSRLAAAVRGDGTRVLPEALQARLERRRAAECLDAEAFAGFSPEFQAASLSVLAARREGLDPSYAVDLMLAVVARRLGKPVVSLETPEGQMAALQMPDAASTAAFVEASLDEVESGRARPFVARLARGWSEGDYADFGRFDEWCHCRDTEAERLSMKRLLDDRNPALAETIDALHAGGRHVFAAVGSLHLFGPLGLPALMRLRGYTVEQGEFAAK